MAQRIVHYAESLEPFVQKGPHTKLGEFEGGALAAVETQLAISLLAMTEQAKLVYFSRESFDYETRRLNAADLVETIRFRLKRFAPRAVNEGFQWLYRCGRRCLTMAAMESRGSTAARGGEAIARELDVLHAIVNEGRFGALTFAEMLVGVLEKDAPLIDDLRRMNPVEASGREQMGMTLARELRSLGRPEFAAHLPVVEPSRGVWIHPADAQLRDSIKARRQTSVDWRDGLVSKFRESEIPGVTQGGQRKANLLYPSGDQFLEDTEELSKPQLYRDFEERLKAGVAAYRDEFLNGARLECALLREAALERAGRERPQAVALLRSQIIGEVQVLAQSLAAAPSWREDCLGAARSYAEANTQMREELGFLESLSGRLGPPDFADRYRKIAKLKG